MNRRTVLSVDNDIQAIILDYQKEFDAVITRLNTLILKYMVDGDPIAETAQAEIRAILDESGYVQTVAELANTGYQDAVDKSYELYRKLYGEKWTFDDEGLARMNTLKGMDIQQYSVFGNNLTQTLEKNILLYSNGRLSRSDALAAVQEAVDVFSSKYVKTWVDTGLSAFYRTATVELAQDNDIKYYQYVGKIIENTRDFCREILLSGNTIRTLDEWNSLDNGQGLAPISVYAGGYNCQHRLVAIPDYKP